MRKKGIATLLVILFVLGANFPASAMTSEQSNAIQAFLDDVLRISRTPGISAAVVAGDDTHFFSSGVAHRRDNIPANEETLWETASVSKAFTAFGILYLEEQGLLSLTDSIADHLPWLTFRYNGQAVNMQEVRLYHFMYHTSGLPLLSKRGQGTLLSGIEALINVELGFFPGEKYSYGNDNYNILGLVIETVSGQSYESFMEERIFRPLGMMNTFANHSHAVATSRLAQGYATQFIFFNVPRNASEAVVIEDLPTGFLVSSAQDMARWMQIQMGLVTDIPEVFRTIIPRSHELVEQVVEVNSDYAAGWRIADEGHRIEHGGNNESFQAFVLMFPEEQIGVTFFVNSCQTVNLELIANSVADILRGNLDATYRMSVMRIMDMALTIITVLGVALAVMFFVLALRRAKEKPSLTKKRIALIALWAIITLAMIAILFVLPQLLIPGGNWPFLLSLVSLSFLTGIIALVLLSASLTCFVVFPRRTK